MAAASLPISTADESDAAQGGAFLGVSQSVKGRAWILRQADEAVVRLMAQRQDMPLPLARLLVSRGVALDEAEGFLNPSLRAQFPDPSSFVDMDNAAGAILDAMAAGRRLCVFADYDVDGATSGAQLLRWWRAAGVEAEHYVPDRLAEGYGPSAEAFQTLKDRGVELVVTVDCGAMAHDALEAGAAIGLDIVVIDHHQMTAAPPKAVAVVNPNRPDCRSGCGYMAAAGVTFVLLAALNREGRRRGLFTDANPAPDLLQWLDLAALGSICDVVPLQGANRALVAQGLKVMARRANPGLDALADVAEAREAASVTAAGFVYGPRINAGGRVGKANLGVRLLSTDEADEAAQIARQLDALNTQRREIEQAVLREARAQLDADLALDDKAVLIAAGAGWHPGVIGVVAGRLKERYGRPVIVIGLPHEDGDPEALGKGSGRSVAGVDLGAAVAAAREAGLLASGGGHAMAAGLSVAPNNIVALEAFLQDAVRRAGPVPAPVVEIDASVSAKGVTRALADSVRQAGPFGQGNPEPLFAVSDVRIASVREVGGGGHLRVRLTDADGASFNAIAFRATDTELGALLTTPDARVHVAVRVKPGQGRYVDVEIEDAAAV